MKLFTTVFIALIAFAGCDAQTSGVKNLSQQDLSTKLQVEDVVVIDVRTPGEIARGYIPETDLFINVNGGDFDQKISTLDTSKTYIIYCHSGARSQQAATRMVAKGFASVFNLQGGISSYKGQLKQ